MSATLSVDDILLKASPEPNTGCWLWTASDNGRGYGRIRHKGRTVQAHRLIYEFVKGEIPHGLELDHTCRVKCCVNPDHLDPIDHRENVRRGAAGATTAKRQRAKTHCPRGHEYSGYNLIVRANGARQCRECVMGRRRATPYAPPRGLPTHCKNGHPLDGPDAIVWRGMRICLICRRARDRKRHARHSLASAGEMQS